MRSFISILCFLYPAAISAQPLFNKSYEISGVIDAFGNTIYANGSYFTCGIISYGGTGKYYLIELDNNGDTIRTKIHGETNQKYLLGWNSLIMDDSSFVFAGTLQDTLGNHPFVAKLNYNFDTIWTSQSWNLPNGYFHSLVQDGDRYVYGGTIENGISPNLFDLFIVNSDTSGIFQWQKILSGSDNEVTYSIDTTTDNGYILSGYKDNVTTNWNIYVVKTDSVGNIQSGWPKTFGTNDSEAGWARTLKDGSYIIWGGWQSGSGNEKAHLRKLYPNGNTDWVKDFQNPGASTIIDVFTDLIETSEGDLVLIGMFYDTTINNPVGWILRTDSLGNEKWRRKLQKRNNDNYLYSISQTPDGGFVMSGNVFPDGGSTTQDGWIIKVDSMGCLIPGCAVGVEELVYSDMTFLVYPNPNDGKFILEILIDEAAGGSSRRQDELQVVVMDIFGRIVFSESITDNKAKFEIDISESVRGIYFLNLYSKTENQVIKIIKE